MKSDSDYVKLSIFDWNFGITKYGLHDNSNSDNSYSDNWNFFKNLKDYISLSNIKFKKNIHM